MAVCTWIRLWRIISEEIVNAGRCISGSTCYSLYNAKDFAFNNYFELIVYKYTARSPVRLDLWLDTPSYWSTLSCRVKSLPQSCYCCCSYADSPVIRIWCSRVVQDGGTVALTSPAHWLVVPNTVRSPVQRSIWLSMQQEIVSIVMLRW